MDRTEALILLRENVNEQNLIKHCLACEAAMQALANYFNKDLEKWGLAGLLHDIDYETTKNDPANHSLIGAQMLEKFGFDKDICEAVKTHNISHNINPESDMAKAIYSVDSLTGLIVAATLVLPSKKISDLNKDNILNRFKEKGFARGAKREDIAKCEGNLGIKLDEFVDIVLKAMQGIAGELGL